MNREVINDLDELSKNRKLDQIVANEKEIKITIYIFHFS
jgi:hypothetical protein